MKVACQGTPKLSIKCWYSIDFQSYTKDNQPMRLFIISITMVLVAGTVCAQTVQEDRRVEEAKRDYIKKIAPKQYIINERLYIDWGGWINYRFSDYEDSDNDSASKDTLENSSDIDTRLWGQLAWIPDGWEDQQTIYVRLKNAFNYNTGGPGIEKHDHDGPHLDYGYGSFKYKSLKAEVGRRYFNIGRGIAYSNVHDGVQLNYGIPGWNIGLLSARTLPHEDNIDFSVPGNDKDTERLFYGLGIGYGGFRGHTLYGYALVQRDESDPSPPDGQVYKYDSEYLGLGAMGDFGEGYSYWLETIKQTGTSHVFGSNLKSEIDAYALNVGLSKEWGAQFEPSLTIEYGFGTGDADRDDVTDTSSGNTTGQDENFLYFGYVPTGVALAPRLSNLHLYRVGFDVRPLTKFKYTEDLYMGVEYFLYRKHRATGAISDLNATVSDRDIGYEWDFYLDWQVMPDINLYFEYGYFVPGDAYAASADDPEKYFSVSLTKSF